MYYVYILYSRSLKRFYVGQTSNLDKRLENHNLGLSKWTKQGVPWQLIYKVECNTRSEAIILERKIKKRGAKRYLEDNDVIFEI